MSAKYDRRRPLKKARPHRKVSDRDGRTPRHASELEHVRKLVQQELITAGKLDGPSRADWTCSDAIGVRPTQVGENTEQAFCGRAAVVLGAGFVVEEAYAYATSELGRFAELARAFVSAGTELLEHAQTNGRPIIGAIANGDLARTAGLTYGSQPNELGTFDFGKLKAALECAGQAVTQVTESRAALVARRPDPVSTGFYGPKAAGPLAHFVLLLHCDGLGTEAIADVLGRLTARPTERSRQAWWREQRQTALGGVRRMLSRARVAGSQDVRLRTGRPSETVRWQDRFLVLICTLDARGSHVISVVGGYGSVPSLAPDGEPVAPDELAFQLRTRR